MDSNNFFLRWRNLDKPNQECQKIFPAKFPMNFEECRQKLDGFGWSTLMGIDVNQENFCGAAILHTISQQIGCLYRLEPNKQANVNENLCLYFQIFISIFQMYRLTIRASKDGVANRLVELLEDQF